MTPSIQHANFQTLRQGYIEIKKFLEKESCVSKFSLKSKIYNDLGCAGDDNLELLEKFVTKYKLDHSEFDYSKHFHSEAELFSSGPALITLLSIPITITIWLLKTITFGHIRLDKIKSPFKQREVLDMSFGDILTWYLTGKYSLRSEVKFKLINQS